MPETLSEELVKRGYFPVILIGTRASGKTSLLTSLFRYLRSDIDAQALCRLGDPIIPIDTVIGEEMASNAKKFFNNIVNEFHDGTSAPRTGTSPYYLPIVFSPTNGQPETKFAILEIPGEAYQINYSSDDLYPAPPWQVADVYQNYPGPIAIMLVGPLVFGDAYEDTIEDNDNEKKGSDLALYGALQNYMSLRHNRHQDNLAFLLTKWDVYTKGLFDKEFSKPPKGLVEHLINQRFPKAWNTFNLLSQENPKKLIVMRYCAGIMKGDKSLTIPQQFLNSVNLYPRQIWSWLFSCANGNMPLYPNENSDLGILSVLRKIFF